MQKKVVAFLCFSTGG